MALSEMLQQARKACDDLNLIWVDGAISFDERHALLAPLDWARAIDLLQKCPPKIVYLNVDLFSFDDELTVELKDAAGASPFAPVAKGVTKLKKEFSKYEGQPQAIFVSFVIESVVHLAVEQEPWFSELENRMTELVNDLEVQREIISKNDGMANDELVRQNGRILAARSEFRAGKSSFEKRVFLARTLFPEVDEYTCQKITTEADNILWLESATPK